MSFSVNRENLIPQVLSVFQYLEVSVTYNHSSMILPHISNNSIWICIIFRLMDWDDIMSDLVPIIGQLV